MTQCRKTVAYPSIFATSLALNLALMDASHLAAQVNASRFKPPTEKIIVAQDSGVTASLRGLFAVTDQVAWASGTGGTVLRTVDGGAKWRDVSIADQQQLDFRDVHAFGANDAIVISAGSPARFYRTTDGGQHWQLVYENNEPSIFFDGMSFWDQERGIAFSDPIDGRLFVVVTQDGAATWNRLPVDSLPKVRDGEAGFAASGTCLATGEAGRVWIGLGGKVDDPKAARVMFSNDFGRHWQTVATPMSCSESSGIFSLAMLDDNRGVAVGGDYLQPTQTAGNVALTTDGGRTWRAAVGKPPGGYRSAVAALSLREQTIFIAAGPTGMDYSLDFGDNWMVFPKASFFPEQGLHTLAFAPDGQVGWGAGSDGVIVRIEIEKLRTK